MNFIISYIQNFRSLLFSLKSTLTRIEKKQDQILFLLKRDEEIAVGLTFEIEVEGKITQGVEDMDLTDSQQGTATAKPLNKRGQPAPVEAGSAIWTGPSFVALTPDPANQLAVTVVAMGIGGDVPGGPLEEFVSLSADADLGAGVVTISGRFPIRVAPSQATTLGFEFGPITEQVEAGPEPNPA